MMLKFFVFQLGYVLISMGVDSFPHTITGNILILIGYAIFLRIIFPMLKNTEKPILNRMYYLQFFMSLIVFNSYFKNQNLGILLITIGAIGGFYNIFVAVLQKEKEDRQLKKNDDM